MITRKRVRGIGDVQCDLDPDQERQRDPDADADMEDPRDADGQDADEAMEVLMSLGVKAAKAEQMVSEIYSPPRITNMAHKHPNIGIKAGFALDLTTCDDEGNPWDFDKKEQREKANNKVQTENHTSSSVPPCAPRSVVCRHSTGVGCRRRPRTP
jgi:hypothetical protein